MFNAFQLRDSIQKDERNRVGVLWKAISKEWRALRNDQRVANAKTRYAMELARSMESPLAKSLLNPERGVAFHKFREDSSKPNIALRK